MEPLFNLSYDKLREAFVHARFAQYDVFGRADIEKWLNEQRGSDDADRTMKGFGRFGGLLVRHASHPLTTEYLSRYATPLPSDGDWLNWTKEVTDEPFDSLIAALMSRGIVQLYRTDEGGPVFTTQGHGFVAKPAGIQTIHDSAFLNVVFGEWNSHGPKAAEARNFLCNTMGRAIAKARKDAQRYFDEAVAVSADGTKIEHASWVFVGEGNSPNSGQLFPAKAFRPSKIKCDTTIARVNVEPWMLERIDLDRRKLTLNRRKLTLDRFLSYMLLNWGESWVVNRVACLVSDTCCRGILKPNETILFVDKSNCPTPLPDGGREIHV